MPLSSSQPARLWDNTCDPSKGVLIDNTCVYLCIADASHTALETAHCLRAVETGCVECEAGYALKETYCTKPSFTIPHCLVSKFYPPQDRYICSLCDANFSPSDGVCTSCVRVG